MFEFEYKESDRGTKEFVLLQPGEANFFIKSASCEDKFGQPLVSQKGLPMMQIEFDMTDCNGQHGRVRQNIAANMGWVLHALGQSIGLDVHTKEGMLDEKILVGKTGRCEIEHSKPMPGSDKVFVQVKRYLPCTGDIRKYDPFDESNLF